MPEVIWQQCIERLQEEIPSQQFNTWIRPLQASMDGDTMTELAPNRFIKDFVSDKFAGCLEELLREVQPGDASRMVLEIGQGRVTPPSRTARPTTAPTPPADPPALSGQNPRRAGQRPSDQRGREREPAGGREY